MKDSKLLLLVFIYLITFYFTYLSYSSTHAAIDLSTKEVWNFLFYKVDGKVHIFGEW